jgi:hypothetical protein
MTLAIEAEKIGDVATTLSLVLVLLPLFTGQRASELRRLKRESIHSTDRRSDVRVELWIILGLLALTVMLVVALWCLFWTVLGDGGLFHRRTTVHTLFFVSSLLVVALLAWQARLLYEICKLLPLRLRKSAQHVEPQAGARPPGPR